MQLTPHGLKHMEKIHPCPHTPPQHDSLHLAPKQVRRQHRSTQQSLSSAASCPKFRSLIDRRTVVWPQNPLTPPFTVPAGPQQVHWQQLHWFITRSPVHANPGSTNKQVLVVWKSRISLYRTFSLPQPQRNHR